MLLEAHDSSMRSKKGINTRVCMCVLLPLFVVHVFI